MSPQNSQSGSTTGVVACVAYCHGRDARAVPVADIAATLAQPNNFLWIGLREPDSALITQVAQQVGAEASVLEDLQAPHRVAKVMDYDALVLIVAMTVEVRVSDGLPSFGETQLLIGDNFLLTIRRGAMAPHTVLRQQLEKKPDRLARGPDYVAAKLLDLLIDRYVVANDQFEKTVETMEQALMLRGIERAGVRRLYQVRRDFQRMHNNILPLGEVCRRLSRLEMTPVSSHAREQFGDLADRVARVDRLLTDLGDGLTFAFEAGMLIEQARQTDTTRRLAAWAAILAVPTAIAGIYGMNFEHMPELKWQYGYLTIVGGMAGICSYLYYRFRKAKWL